MSQGESRWASWRPSAWTAAIEAADAMGKAARVQVKTVCNADAGILSVVCEGDLAACVAAVDAGKAAAERMGSLLTSNLIARPYSDTDDPGLGARGLHVQTEKGRRAQTGQGQEITRPGREGSAGTLITETTQGERPWTLWA